MCSICFLFFFLASRRLHTRYWRDCSSDVCSSDLREQIVGRPIKEFVRHDRQEGVGRRLCGAAGDAAFLEEKLVRADGTEVCVEAAAVPFVYREMERAPCRDRV